MLKFYGFISNSLHLRLYTTMKSTIFYSNGRHFIKQSRNTAILSGITLLPFADPHTIYNNRNGFLDAAQASPSGWLYAIIAVSSGSTPDPILKAQAKGSLGAFSAKTMQIAVGAIAEPIHIEIRISYSCKVVGQIKLATSRYPAKLYFQKDHLMCYSFIEI